jgi:heptosyltransferase-2
MKEIQYRFYPNTSPTTLRRIKLIDRFLYLFKRNGDEIPIAPAFKEITIAQLAHIGDLMLLLPAIKALKSISNYKISLLVSSQNYTIASRLNFINDIIVADAPYFSRGKKGSYAKYIRQLRKVKTGLIYDVRGDLRNNFFIKFFVRKKLFVGYDVGGGGALLDVVLPFTHGSHVTNLFEPLFKYLGFPEINVADHWNEEDMPFDEITDLAFPDDFLVVHLGTGAQARKWPVDNFIETIELVSGVIPVYVMGVPDDLSQNQMDIISSMPNVTNCIGKYSVLQSIYIIKQCSLFLGLDSGFSHIASLLKKKIVVLFSGTVNKNVWKPFSFYTDQVILLNQKVECDWGTGCGRLVCGNNICMKLIAPAKVAEVIKESLNTYNLAS